ncbi:MAG TPA: hypothetical protein VGR34_00785 [Candidatus Dormibacteraeota bacterium]|nr:hypothetical protein [Candidatus Dormibacteraeota bacterium]
MIKRFDNWPGLLDAFVASRRELPFAWGANDCCLFACDAVLAMTGEDLAEGFRDSYDSALGARRMLQQAGAETVGELADIIAERQGLRCIPAIFAQRGDVVLLDREPAQAGESLGIVSLHGVDVWAPAEEGLAIVPLREGQRAWRI